MYHLQGDNAIFFDVDNTLIMWNVDENDPRVVWIPSLAPNGEAVPVVPHEHHLLMIKRHKQLGNTVVVWSKSGSLWAKQIVEYFGLTSYVDLVCSKPSCFYDDLKPEEFLVDRRYTQQD